MRRARSPLLSASLSLVVSAAGVSALSAQEATVRALAPILAAEDARRWSPDLLRGGLGSRDTTVRRVAALAVGRIGNRAGTAILLPLLSTRDTVNARHVAFALGLLRDTTATQPLIDRLTSPPALDTAAALEVVTGLAKIGGARAGAFFGALLAESVHAAAADAAGVRRQAALEAWRLGSHAPVEALITAADTISRIRSDAVYSLARLRAPAAGRVLLGALDDPDPLIRAHAARALTRPYADSAEVSRAAVAARLIELLGDADAGARINALRSLGTFREPTHAVSVIPLLHDSWPQVRVQVAMTLGDVGGPESARALANILRTSGDFAVRREALVALARADPGAFRGAAVAWTRSGDWRERAAAAEGAAVAGPDSAPVFLADRDGRVAAAGLQAWLAAAPPPSPALVAAARPLLAHSDAAVRSLAAEAVSRAADIADLPALVNAYRASSRDSFPEAALSTLAALLAISKGSPESAARVAREFLDPAPPPSDYLRRRWAESNWPEAAKRWGAAFPVVTGRGPAFYEDLAARYVVPAASLRRPRAAIETEDHGTIEIELFAADAPLTVANFLGLVDRGFFDGRRWHRVVPNFAIQDGDPRGDGWGGPGGAIRDEINRHRYREPMLGMALSGPDTGSSQWFVNLSPQPHLDGTYTIFGRVVGSPPIDRIVQGDFIRAVTLHPYPRL